MGFKFGPKQMNNLLYVIGHWDPLGVVKSVSGTSVSVTSSQCVTLIYKL